MSTCLECRAAPGFICDDHSMTDNHTEAADPELALIEARRELETTRFALADLLAAFSVTTANYTPEQQRTARQASLLLNPPKPDGDGEQAMTCPDCALAPSKICPAHHATDNHCEEHDLEVVAIDLRRENEALRGQLEVSRKEHAEDVRYLRAEHGNILQKWHAARISLSVVESERDALKAKIGEPPPGSHPAEAVPRDETWHKERANWAAEVEGLRHALSTLRSDFQKYACHAAVPEVET